MCCVCCAKYGILEIKSIRAHSDISEYYPISYSGIDIVRFAIVANVSINSIMADVLIMIMVINIWFDEIQ